MALLGRHGLLPAVAPAHITAFKLWTSTDVTGGTNGNDTANYRVPDYSATAGTVSIKAQATDSSGNTTDQTIDNAYKLNPAK